MVEELFIEASDELQLLLWREVTYEEVMDYMDAKLTGAEDVFLETLKRKENRK